jgi:hypothetical protein
VTRIVMVKYVGPFTASVPILGIEVSPSGIPIEVSPDIAGRPPGPWRTATDDDPVHWPRRRTDDGSRLETHDPGEGLLAQTDVWQPIITDPQES